MKLAKSIFALGALLLASTSALAADPVGWGAGVWTSTAEELFNNTSGVNIQPDPSVWIKGTGAPGNVEPYGGNENAAYDLGSGATNEVYVDVNGVLVLKHTNDQVPEWNYVTGFVQNHGPTEGGDFGLFSLDMTGTRNEYVEFRVRMSGSGTFLNDHPSIFYSSFNNPTPEEVEVITVDDSGQPLWKIMDWNYQVTGSQDNGTLNGWHTYALRTVPGQGVMFYKDGIASSILRFTNAVMPSSQYLDLKMGMLVTGTNIVPGSKLEVDYVRKWQCTSPTNVGC